MAIIWKQKKTKSKTPKFYHARGGLVLKLSKKSKIPTNQQDTWAIDFSCYTNGRSIPLKTQQIRVNQAESVRYYSNLKNRAAKVAKRMVMHYIERMDKFSISIAGK